MRYAYSGIFLVLIVVTAAAISGCAGSPASPTPVPTDTPAATGVTPQPTATVKSGSLFDTDDLKWFEYRMSSSGNGVSTVSDVRFDYTTATFNGLSVKDDRITLKMSDPDMVVVMDSYYDMATDRQIGSHMKMVSSGITMSDQDIAAGNERYRNSDVTETYSSGDWPMTCVGTDLVAAGGKTYTCTKYSVGRSGEHGTAWVSSGVPVPVRIESKSPDGVSSIWELTGWG